MLRRVGRTVPRRGLAWSAPKLILATALVACIVLVTALTWQALSAYQSVRELGDTHVRAERLASELNYLDEVLTSSTRLAAATGDQRWGARYTAHSARLTEVLAELRALDKGAFDPTDLLATDLANTALVRMEQRALGLSDSGRLAAAQRLLDGRSYRDQKLIYAQGVEAATTSIRANVNAQLEAERRRALSWISIALGALTATLALLLLLWRRLDSWSRAEAEAAAERHAAERERAEWRFTELTKSSSDVGMVIRDDGTIVHQSEAVTRVLGHPPGSLIDHDLTDLVHPEDRASVREQLRSKGGEPSTGEFRLRDVDSSWHIMEGTWRDLRDNPTIAGHVLNAIDVTARVEAQNRAIRALTAERTSAQELKRSQDLFNHLVRNAPIVVFALDAEGRFTLSTGKGLEKLGLEEGQVVGQSAFEIYREDETVLKHLTAALAGETVGDRIEYGDKAFESVYVPIIEDDEVTGMVGISTDVTRHAELERELRLQAAHDTLTGLANRDTFRSAVRRSLDKDPASTCVLIVDLDEFKEINDARGHEDGDHVLAEVAHRLREHTREEDLAARLGGDEFGVLIETGSEELADAIAARLLEAIAEPFEAPSGPLKVAASIGVAGPGFTGESVGQAMRDADLAMYEAKRRGKGGFVRFQPDMREEFVQRVRLRGELDLAIERDQFEVHYQPIWDLATGSVWAVEALVRWRHPERGLLSPAAFVPIAEETGQIVAIDRLVMWEACRQVAHWRASGERALANLCASVNVSRADFVGNDVLHVVRSILGETGLPPEALVMEITETTMMENIEPGASTLDALADLGVTVALDDFGTGYSSLSELQRLKIDVLKIDRDFVSSGEDDARQSLSETIAGLGKLLGLSVVAEGIENASQLSTMRSLGCDRVQGYLLSRPLPAQECAGLIRTITTAPPAELLSR